MKTNNIIVFAFLSFLFFLNLSCKNGNSIEDVPDTPSNESTYDVLGIKEIPIGLWVTPSPNYQNSSEYKKIKECGLNFVNGFHYHEANISSILKVLDYCKDNGLKFFANKAEVHQDIVKYSNKSDATLLKKFTEAIKTYADHPAFAGELIMDEPGKPLFEAVAAFSNAFAKAYPSKIAHVNLFPSYATGGIQAPTYEDYINNWIATQKPKHISFDSYPLLTNGRIIDDYYYNLDLIRAKSKFKKIPFWTFVQTLSISGTSGVPDKREPSEVDIRWQVWSHLALGAKGIQYFCYWSPGNGTEQFGAALIGLEGQKTVRYDYVKKLNSDINAIGKILLECDAEGVIQNGTTNYRLYAPLYHFADIESTSGDNSIVGCFKSNDGKAKVLITTTTPNQSGQVQLNLKSSVKTVKVWADNTVKDQNVVDNKISLQLAAGEAVFIEF